MMEEGTLPANMHFQDDGALKADGRNVERAGYQGKDKE